MSNKNKERATKSAMELIKEAGCVMKDADLLSLLRGIYKAGYRKALKSDNLVEEENSPRLPYL